MEAFSTETQKLLFAIAELAVFPSYWKPLCNLVIDGLHVICFRNQGKKLTNQKNQVSSFTYFKSEDRGYFSHKQLHFSFSRTIHSLSYGIIHYWKIGATMNFIIRYFICFVLIEPEAFYTI